LVVAAPAEDSASEKSRKNSANETES